MKSRKLNISHFLLLIFLYSLFFVAGCTEQESAAEPGTYEIITKVEGYGDAEFDQISPGMSLGQLNQIIGFEGELMGSSKEGDTVYETYQWQLNKEATLSGDFEDKIVVLFSG